MKRIIFIVMTICLLFSIYVYKYNAGSRILFDEVKSEDKVLKSKIKIHYITEYTDGDANLIGLIYSNMLSSNRKVEIIDADTENYFIFR